MKKFIFKLETTLAVRKVKEGTFKRELEQANQKWNQMKEEEKMLATQIDALSEEMHQKRKAGRLDLQETYSQILEHLHGSLGQVQHHLVTQQRQIDEQKERLQQAIQERKVIEKIKEKHYAGWKLSETRSDGALQDEISIARSNRKTR